MRSISSPNPRLPGFRSDRADVSHADPVADVEQDRLISAGDVSPRGAPGVIRFLYRSTPMARPAVPKTARRTTAPEDRRRGRRALSAPPCRCSEKTNFRESRCTTPFPPNIRRDREHGPSQGRFRRRPIPPTTSSRAASGGSSGRILTRPWSVRRDRVPRPDQDAPKIHDSLAAQRQLRRRQDSRQMGLKAKPLTRNRQSTIGFAAESSRVKRRGAIVIPI